MPRLIEKAEKQTLPVVPLRGLVAFPSIPLNFELQRDISKDAVKASRSGYGSLVLLLTQKDINVEKPTADDLYNIGCVAKLRQSIRLPGSETTSVVAEGISRASVISIYEKDGYLLADVMVKTVSGDFNKSDVRIEALLECTLNSLEGMLRFQPQISENFMSAAEGIENPGQLADFIAAEIFVRYQDKMEVLSIFDPLKRCEKCDILLESETELMQTEADIQSKVKDAVNHNQRDFYLREQLKIIENELGINDDVNELEEKLKKASLPAEVRERLEKELMKFAKSSPGSPEAGVIYNYIETCLDIPWNKTSKDRLDIAAAAKILDADHDGLRKVKDRILEYLAVKQLNPNLKNQILCLVGPPGVGKTSLGASIAHAMKRSYVRVSLGGVRDESDIRGHRKTYIGSMPGRIIDALTQCKTMNPVMLLDEVDKLCSDMRGDPASALLEVLDSEQNKAFRDHFIELPVDLSDVLFICTANTLDTVPRPLLDRMEVIELHTYTPTEKLAIAEHHLIPKQLKRHGMTKRSLKLAEPAIREIISGYTRESGVRNLEREIASLCRKAAKVLVEDKEKKSVTVDLSNLESFLGPRKFIDDTLSAADLVGVTNGLAYTEVGGDVLKAEALVVDGTGHIELTGTLGDVMKESARIAVTYIRAHCSEYGIAPDFYKTKDIHIHFPEGAVPKDGPSAGVTMTVSLVSALSGIPVRHDIAMTGEITLTGRVIPIGGLREKATAAYSMGLRTLLIPRENMRDISELDEIVRTEITFIPCDTLNDVLSRALVRPEKKNDTAAREERCDVILPSVDDGRIVTSL